MITNLRLLQLLCNSNYYELADALKQNIVEDEARRKGKSSELAFVKKFFRNQPKDTRSEFKNVLKQENMFGREVYFVTDGYCMITLTDNFGYPVIDSNLLNVFPEERCMFLYEYNYATLIAELAIAKMLFKKEKKAFVLPGTDFLFNPIYLYTFLTFMGADTKILKGSSRAEPLVLQNNDHRALILPVLGRCED
jgi:hypothetical protein